MTRKIDETPAYEVLSQILDALENSKGAEESVDISDLEPRLVFLADRFLRVDPNLAPPHLLANMQNNLNPARDEINSYLSNGNRQHLSRAIEALGKATQQVLGFPLAESVNDSEESVSNILARARKDATQLIETISDRVEHVAITISEITRNQESLEEDIRSAKARSDEVIADFQKQFSENENSRNERFESRIESIKAEGYDVFKSITDDAADLRQSLSEQSEELLNLLKTRDTETKQLAKAMGATGISATYQASANRNQIAADVLRALAIIAFLITAGLAMWAVSEFESAGFERSLIRLFSALLFVLPATYMARESSRQRTEAVRSRRIEIELAALNPFIEPLDDGTKDQLRKDLIDTYFGRAFDTKDEKEEDTIKVGGTLVDLVKSLKDVFK